MSDKNNMPDFNRVTVKLKKDLVRYASGAGVRFFKARFRDQAWHDRAKEPWAKRKDDFGRAILVGRGYLRDSIRVISKSDDSIKFGTDVRYAKIHNEGGTIQVRITKRSRKFFWFMYSRTGDAKWKGMALTKKTVLIIKIPKRQFIGHSEKLINEIDEWIINHIERDFKKAINDA